MPRPSSRAGRLAGLAVLLLALAGCDRANSDVGSDGAVSDGVSKAIATSPGPAAEASPTSASTAPSAPVATEFASALAPVDLLPTAEEIGPGYGPPASPNQPGDVADSENCGVDTSALLPFNHGQDADASVEYETEDGGGELVFSVVRGRDEALVRTVQDLAACGRVTVRAVEGSDEPYEVQYGGMTADVEGALVGTSYGAAIDGPFGFSFGSATGVMVHGDVTVVVVWFGLGAGSLPAPPDFDAILELTARRIEGEEPPAG